MTITNSFENFLLTSNRKPKLIQSVDVSEFVNKLFTDFLNKNNIKKYSRYTTLGVVFAEMFNRSIRDLLKKVVFLKRDGNWNNEVSPKTKQ